MAGESCLTWDGGGAIVSKINLPFNLVREASKGVTNDDSSFKHIKEPFHILWQGSFFVPGGK
ncbi:MAG TPA: hypothetical protein PLN25_10555 [Deltaproteobacteria bacterium]|nr:hypothetical protein [Deltaproteobacteria bacterium]